jgi:hypothetical protein
VLACSENVKDHTNPSDREIEEQVGRILEHRSFANSERISRLLRYVVEQSRSRSATELKEYAIGLDVFDREASFDPRQDSAVRVSATRLRGKLAEYYERDGRDDPVLVELPRGAASRAG